MTKKNFKFVFHFWEKINFAKIEISKKPVFSILLKFKTWVVKGLNFQAPKAQHIVWTYLVRAGNLLRFFLRLEVLNQQTLPSKKVLEFNFMVLLNHKNARIYFFFNFLELCHIFGQKMKKLSFWFFRGLKYPRIEF